MAEQYTSEQYKYLLLKQLQRYFSASNAKRRAYYYNFFWELFDGVTVSEEAYNSFVSQMEDEIDYCAKNSIHKASNIPSSEVESHSLLLIQSFASIGVTMELIYTKNSDGTDSTDLDSIRFTKPDGKVLLFGKSLYMGGENADDVFCINARSGGEYRYAKLSAPYYQMRNMEVVGLNEVNGKAAGPGTWWSYDADTAAVTVTGSGAYAGATKEEQLGSGAYTTVILGANVSRLLADSLEDPAITTVVLLHGADAPLTLDSEVVDKKNTKEWTVYADNEDFRNFAWPSSVKITWYTLEEWEG